MKYLNLAGPKSMPVSYLYLEHKPYNLDEDKSSHW